MSHRNLPVLFINLGGEMIYIIDARLKAQMVEKDRANKVMNDIVSTMFNRRFIEEIFEKHQPIYSRRVLKTMFDKLAHASIMKLNSNSMDKLYDLMTMAVKYQVLMCHHPRQLIPLTLNHLDAILSYVSCSSVKKNVEVAFNYFVDNYASMSIGELQAVRFSILNFFQDIHVRISAFLQDKVQHNDGSFVIPPPTLVYPGTDLPGTIKFMNSSGEVVETNKFYPGQEYKSEMEMLGLEIGAERSTRLGENIYLGKCSESVNDARPPAASGRQVPSSQAGTNKHIEREDTSGELAKEELNLLAKLIGTKCDVKKKEMFKLNLFDPEPECYEGPERENQALDFSLSIDVQSSRKRGDIDKIITEMTITRDEEDEEDLLALMDKAT